MIPIADNVVVKNTDSIPMPHRVLDSLGEITKANRFTWLRKAIELSEHPELLPTFDARHADMYPGDEIPEEDPEVIAELEAENAALKAANADLTTQVQTLTGEVDQKNVALQGVIDTATAALP